MTDLDIVVYGVCACLIVLGLTIIVCEIINWLDRRL